MGITNVVIASRAISVGEGTITVRGLALPDLMTLVDLYGPQLVITFQRVQQGGSLDTKDVRLLIGTLLKEFPDMVCSAMALAADSFDEASIELMRKLPFTKQLEVVEATFGLTFAGEGEVKKLVESLTRMMAEVSGALTEVELPLPIGTGGSDGA